MPHLAGCHVRNWPMQVSSNQVDSAVSTRERQLYSPLFRFAYLSALSLIAALFLNHHRLQAARCLHIPRS